MFIEAIINLGISDDDYENPKFYMTFDEFNSFLKICSNNNYQLLVREISEEEYNKMNTKHN